MKLSRRDVAAAGALALGVSALLGSSSAKADSPDMMVKDNVEALRMALLNADKAKLEALTADQLSYSHSDGRVEDKAKFINGVMTRKAVVKSIEWPEMTIQIVLPNAIVRHLYVSESELDGKTNNVRIGALQVWQKQGNDWKLLARAGIKLG
jgi:hypothetical protein